MTRSARAWAALAAASLLLAGAAAAAVWQWQARRRLELDLSRYPGGQDPAEVRADGEQAERRAAALAARNAAAAIEVDRLELRFRGSESAERDRRRLALLNLAASLALAVDDARLVPPGSDDPALAAWRRAFAAEPGRHPVLLRLRMRGPFAGTLRFCEALPTLPWGAVPVLLELHRVPTAGAAARRSGGLDCDLVVML